MFCLSSRYATYILSILARLIASEFMDYRVRDERLPTECTNLSCTPARNQTKEYCGEVAVNFDCAEPGLCPNRETPDGSLDAAYDAGQRHNQRAGSSGMSDVHHFIDGKRAEGASGRWGDVFNPATGEQSRRGRLRRRRRGRPRGRGRARRPFPAGPRPRRCAARASCSSSASCSSASTTRWPRLITAEHGKVLSDAAGRGHARHRGGRVRLRHPAAAEGRVHREGRHAASTAGRCASRSASCAGITPFNFPAMVPMWMFPVALACGNTFILKPSERDPSAALPHGRAAEGGRPARRRVQRRQRRQGGGRRDPAPSRHRRGQLRRLDADRRVHLRDRRRGTASACRRWAAPRTTWW